MNVSNRIHIGHEIEARINELRITKSEFARRIGTSKQNIARILERESIDTSTLLRYGEALDCNFFNLYADVLDTSIKASDHSQAAGRDIHIGTSSRESELEKENQDLRQQLIEAQSKIIRLMENENK